MHVERDIPLAPLTTLGVGGPARSLIRAGSTADLERAVAFAHEAGLPVFFLGSGSNILVSDEGFPGVVITSDSNGIAFEPQGAGVVQVTAGAGERWDTLVAESVARGLCGIENLSGIPGTVGAAPVQNIGAYGCELSDVLSWVEVFDVRMLTTRRLSRAECAFGYRDSIFKREAGAPRIVTRVCITLREGAAPDISYRDLAEHFRERAAPDAAAVRDAVLAIRTRKFPHRSSGAPRYGTAGSFFRHPIVPQETANTLTNAYPDMPVFKMKSGAKLSASWLLEHVGAFKGVRRGDAGVWPHHALVLVNYGAARAADLHALADEMADTIREKTGITLEREVGCVGPCACGAHAGIA